MTEVVGVKFKKIGKVYYFSPNKLELKLGDQVIVKTARGTELGEVAMLPREVEDSTLVHPLKKVLRLATEEDRETARQNREKERETMAICEKAIEAHGLDMKLVDVEYTFDGNKLLFYFTSDGRVDFRELVKDPAARFKTRIELRQIGVRDEAKMQGGLGICGKEFCCTQFLGEFAPVSIKMAKEQGLSLNPAKISGTCGRLMCCLKYEQAAYEDLTRTTPGVGSLVQTPDYKGVVTEVNLLRGILKVRRANEPDGQTRSYRVDQLKVLNERSGYKPKYAEDLDKEED